MSTAQARLMPTTHHALTSFHPDVLMDRHADGIISITFRAMSAAIIDQWFTWVLAEIASLPVGSHTALLIDLRSVPQPPPAALLRGIMRVLRAHPRPHHLTLAILTPPNAILDVANTAQVLLQRRASARFFPAPHDDASATTAAHAWLRSQAQQQP